MSETAKKKPLWKRILKTILLILLILILLIAGTLTVFGFKNKRVMFQTISEALSCVSQRHELTAVDPGEYADMRMYGIMKFHTDQYDVEDLGNLSVMTADMGMMQMVSFMITPAGKEVPLCTLDFMYILGTRKSYVEFYDLVPDAQSETYQKVLEQLCGIGQRFADIPDIEVSKAWYDNLLTVSFHKQFSSKQDQENMDLFLDALSTYLVAEGSLEPLSPEDTAAQIANTKAYSDGLISNGGVSTDVFKKSLGEDKTRDFFDRVFFGTARQG